MSTRKTSDGGVEMMGDLCAPEGSAAWCVGMKNEIEKLLSDRQFNHQQLELCLAAFREFEGWKKLKDAVGCAFLYYEDFCKSRPPFGLGYDPDAIDAIIAERKAKERKARTKQLARANDTPLNGHGGERHPSKDEKQKDANYGTTASYRIRKLRRDHPKIAARLDAGEFKSVASAERASRGEDPDPPRRNPTPLQWLRRWWKKASPEERSQFLSEVSDE